MTADWIRKPVPFFQHLLRETDAAGLCSDGLIDEAASAGARGYIAMAGGFSAWYPSELAAQTVNPHMTGDVLGELLAAAERADIRVLARMDISKGRPGDEARHPERFVRKPDGTISTLWEMPQICATGPFWTHENFAILEEILARYRPDGFFYNYFYVPRCYCERCQRLVRAATGADVPAPGTRTVAYERWRQATLAGYTAEMARFIHARAPDAALVPYHHVRDGWDARAMAAASDIVASQISNPVVPNPIDPQPMWAHWAGEEAQMARALKPGVAPLLLQTTSEFFASRQTEMPAGRIVHNMIQAAAHGASVAPALNGRMSDEGARIAPALRAYGALQASQVGWHCGLVSVARIALVKSEDSLRWGPDQGKLAGDPAGQGHVAEFRGLYQSLVGLRQPFDIVMAGELSADDLARYALVILPGVCCLSQHDAVALDDYAANGGAVLASGDLASHDAAGAQWMSAALRVLPALPGAPRSVVGAYLEPADLALRDAIGGAPFLGVSGAFWTPFGAGVAGDDLRLIGPFANNAPEFTHVAGPGTVPGLIRRGRATWLPWQIGALYHRHGLPEYRALLGHIVADIAGEPPVCSTAPQAVEFTCYRHAAGLVVHAINGATGQGTDIIETVPLAGFDIAVRTDAATVLDLTSGQPLASRRDGDRVVVHLNRLDTFAALAFVGEGS